MTGDKNQAWVFLIYVAIGNSHYSGKLPIALLVLSFAFTIL